MSVAVESINLPWLKLRLRWDVVLALHRSATLYNLVHDWFLSFNSLYAYIFPIIPFAFSPLYFQDTIKFLSSCSFGILLTITRMYFIFVNFWQNEDGKNSLEYTAFENPSEKMDILQDGWYAATY